MSQTNLGGDVRRHRVGYSLISTLVVISSLASTFFAFLPVGAAVNCYPADGWSHLGVGVAIPSGLVALSGWLVVLKFRVTRGPPVNAVSAILFVIFVLSALPAVLNVGEYGPISPGRRAQCGVTVPLAILEGWTVFSCLLTIALANLLAKFVRPWRRALIMSGLSGLCIWSVYLLVLRPF
jgi:hypothetical protein